MKQHKSSRLYIVNKKRQLQRKKRIRKLVRNMVVTTIALVGVLSFGEKPFEYYASKKNTEDTSNQESENINLGVNNEDVVVVEEEVNSTKYLSLEDDIYADDAKEIEGRLSNWNFIREDERKIAYLTFDDGPSVEVTPMILDVLNKNDVKATFFMLGSEIEKSDEKKEVLKEVVEGGHAIGNHGYSHNYDYLYPNGTVDVQAFLNDMKRSEDVMKSVLGNDFSTRVIRFPGGHGSWDTDNVDIALEENGYKYIDWNSLNGDAEGNNKNGQELKSRFVDTVSDLYGNSDTLVILMHDKAGKESTAQSLEDIINYLKTLGYEFRTLK